MSTRALVISLFLTVCCALASPMAHAQASHVANGDFDMDTASWSAAALPGSVAGTVTLTQASEDALDFPDSGSLELSWNIADPTGSFTLVRIARSSCVTITDTSGENRGGFAERVVTQVAGNLENIFFCRYDSADCTTGAVCGSTPPTLMPEFTFSGLSGVSFAGTTQSFDVGIIVALEPDGGGGTISSGTHRIDKVFHRRFPGPPPALLALASLDSTAGLTAFFSGDLSGGASPYPARFMWDFGDGESSTEQNPAHTYTAAGTYTVTLTVDTGFEQASDSLTVQVDDATVQEIPTLSGLSLALLAALLGGLALVLLRRQRL